MTYNIIYTERAEQDLVDIYKYIALNLKESKTAKRQTERLREAICKLDTLPFRHTLYGEDIWRSKGLRFFPIDNYLIFYSILEKENIVAVIRIMSEKRNVELQLAGLSDI